MSQREREREGKRLRQRQRQRKPRSLAIIPCFYFPQVWNLGGNIEASDLENHIWKVKITTPIAGFQGQESVLLMITALGISYPENFGLYGNFLINVLHAVHYSFLSLFSLCLYKLLFVFVFCYFSCRYHNFLKFN